jgi:hypothetical protein
MPSKNVVPTYIRDKRTVTADQQKRKVLDSMKSLQNDRDFRAVWTPSGSAPVVQAKAAVSWKERLEAKSRYAR